MQISAVPTVVADMPFVAGHATAATVVGITGLGAAATAAEAPNLLTVLQR